MRAEFVEKARLISSCIHVVLLKIWIVNSTILAVYNIGQKNYVSLRQKNVLKKLPNC